MRNQILTVASCLLLAAFSNVASAQTKGPSSSQTPYVTPVAPGVHITSILTAGDVVNGYKMAGIPDGTGAFDNGNGTFTFLVNHEIPNNSGAVRAHGSKGAFVSKWIINKSNLSVVSGGDLMQTLKLWNGSGYTTYNTANPYITGLSRFCSADLPQVSAFYNSATGKGAQERIFMNGEESGTEGRGFAHIVTGPNAGTSYELPYLGKFSWENSVANPATGDKTVVAGLDDATPGQVYFYIGTKTNTGTEIEKAGLSNGNLYAPAVSGMLLETSASIPPAGTTFTMKNLGDVHNSSGTVLNTNSNNAGVTQFLRPEDGLWDPAHPEDFYFVTTNAFNSPSRLWKMHFNNINDLTQGGTITVLLDGTEGQQMFDNITIDRWGHIFLQEDVGGNARLGKIWQYTIATDVLKEITSHDANRFISGAPNFLTIDEEASGIINVQEILGAGMFLMVDQAHYSVGGEVYEGGQLLAMYNPDTYNACASYSASIAVNPSPAVPGQAANTIYLGYGPQTVTLNTTVPSENAPYTYSWSNSSATTSSLQVNPTITTEYTVTVKNAFGCAVNATKTVNVVDIRNGNKNKVFICHNGHTLSVSVNAVPDHLSHGDKLGRCADESLSLKNGIEESNDNAPSATLYPNPATNKATVLITLNKSEEVTYSVVDMEGRIVMKNAKQKLGAGKQLVNINTSALSKGTYFVNLSYGNTQSKLKMIIVR